MRDISKIALELSKKLNASLDAGILEEIISLFNCGVLKLTISTPKHIFSSDNCNMTVSQCYRVDFDGKELITSLQKELQKIKAEKGALQQSHTYAVSVISLKNERIAALQRELQEVKAELKTMATQKGVACLTHDLVHYLTCGHCQTDLEREKDRMRKALLKIAAFEADFGGEVYRTARQGCRDFKAKEKIVVDKEVFESLRNIKDLQSKKLEVVKYCYPHLDQMWAATCVGILLGCDFRDAKSHATDFLRDKN